MKTHTGYNANGKKNDFRSVNRGESQNIVKEQETHFDLQDEDSGILIYKGQLSNRNVNLIYSFFDKQLTSATYFLNEEYSNENDYLIAHEDMKNLLIKKYGIAKGEHQYGFWSNRLYQDDPDSKGFAISVGHLAYLSIRETENTEIKLFLSGNNSEIKLIIQYSSKALSHLEQEAQEQEDFDNI